MEIAIPVVLVLIVIALAGIISAIYELIAEIRRLRGE